MWNLILRNPQGGISFDRGKSKLDSNQMPINPVTIYNCLYQSLRTMCLIELN